MKLNDSRSQDGSEVHPPVISVPLGTASRSASDRFEEASMRTRLTGKMAIAATLIVGLGAAGCGSSKSKSASSTSTASTPALSKAAFLKQGNAICRQGNRKINADASRVFTRNRRPTRAE